MSQTSADRIGALSFYGRLARKLSRKGVLKNLLTIQRLGDDAEDSFPSEVERAAQKWPNGIAVKFEDRTWTWRELNDQANQYAHVLAARGVAPGQVVAINMGNRPEMLLALVATTKLGAIAALLNTSLRGDALTHCIELVNPAALVVGEEQYEPTLSMGGEISARAKVLLAVPDTGSSPLPAGFVDLATAAHKAPNLNRPETQSIRLGDPAVYIFTSGTTGLPKAAVTPHRRLFFGGIYVGRVLRELTPDDTIYGPLPLYHSTGLLGGFAACVFTGAAFVPARRFSASTFWDEIRQYDATGFNYVGEVLRYLYNSPPGPGDRDHRVRTIFGAGLRHDIWPQFKERFGIAQVHELYGGSETPAGFMNLLNYDRTCGWNPRGWKTIEFDADAGAPARNDAGRAIEVGPGGTGLLIMRIDADQQFDGYTDKAASETKILRDLFEEGDTWFNSGDLMLNQGHGHARFVDRTGDTYRWQSENVATTQVEAVLSTWPQVADCVAYGVEVPGYEGRCGMARIVLREGTAIDEVGLAQHLRTELPPFAVPRFLRIGEAVEMTGTFKHKKNELRDAGFDPTTIDEPVLALLPRDDAWRTLDAGRYTSISDGTERL